MALLCTLIPQDSGIGPRDKRYVPYMILNRGSRDWIHHYDDSFDKKKAQQVIKRMDLGEGLTLIIGSVVCSVT